MTLDKTKKTLLIIDSHALIHRAYHAFPPTLKTLTGEPVNAVFGFAGLLLDVLLKFKPTNVVAVFDSPGPTIRQEAFTQYKANRAETDDLLAGQFPRCHELAQMLNIPVVMLDGVEADDLIGTIDAKHSGKWAQTIIVSGDRDLFQLVDDDTFVYMAGNRFAESKVFDAAGVKEKMGVDPDQITDYKGLSGDASDNIPGVRGIGPKGAVDLLTKFGHLEDIYTKIDEVDKKYKQKLLDNYDIAILSKQLATIHRDIPITFDFESTKYAKNFNLKKTKDFFQEMQFKSLVSRLDSLAKEFGVQESITMFDTEAQEPELATKPWDGKVKAEVVYFLSEFENLDQNPLYWGINKVLFAYEDKDEVFEVQKDKIADFFEAFQNNVKVTFDKKKIMHALWNNKIFLNLERVIDVGINAYILGEGNVKFDLKNISNFGGIPFSEKMERNVLNLKTIYFSITEKLSKPENKKLSEVIDLEDAILSTILEMERKGIMSDIPLLKKFEQKLREKLENLKSEIYKSAGHEFNINSPRQVSDVLFKEKTLPTQKKTKGGAYSTDEITLKKLIGVDPIVENLLAHREVDKLVSTYLSTLPEYVDNDGRIHSVFDQFGAVSGRFASKNPNLQNIPLIPTHDVNIRDTFISAPEHIFVSFDFSQQELRILAALSGEKEMIESFNGGTDIHKVTAAEIFEKEVDKVTSEERQFGKTVNFSVIYGISSFGLSERLKIDRKTADTFIKKYFSKYKEVQAYLISSLERAKGKGYAETIMGRRRSSEMLKSNNRILRSAAERELFNFAIQGSAADIMKVAMKKFPEIENKYKAKLLLQIHDEFLFEFEVGKISEKDELNSFKKDVKLKQFAQDVREIMCSSVEIGVSYKVDVSVGRRWGSMQDIEF